MTWIITVSRKRRSEEFQPRVSPWALGLGSTQGGTDPLPPRKLGLGAARAREVVVSGATGLAFTPFYLPRQYYCASTVLLLLLLLLLPAVSDAVGYRSAFHSPHPAMSLHTPSGITLRYTVAEPINQRKDSHAMFGRVYTEARRTH